MGFPRAYRDRLAFRGRRPTHRRCPSFSRGKAAELDVGAGVEYNESTAAEAALVSYISSLEVVSLIGAESPGNCSACGQPRYRDLGACHAVRPPTPRPRLFRPGEAGVLAPLQLSARRPACPAARSSGGVFRNSTRGAQRYPCDGFGLPHPELEGVHELLPTEVPDRGPAIATGAVHVWRDR